MKFLFPFLRVNALLFVSGGGGEGGGGGGKYGLEVVGVMEGWYGW